MKKEKDELTRIYLSVNDEPFILESEKGLTDEDKEYLKDIAMDFFSRNEWDDEEINYRITLSAYEIVELILAMSNEVKDMNLHIKNVDLELYVAD